MYLKHFGLTEKPFENTPDPKFLYMSPMHEEAITRMLYVIRENKGFGMLSGIYGCGKTLVANAIQEELKAGVNRYHCAFVFNPVMDEVDILKEIAYQLGYKQTLAKEKVEVLRVLSQILEQNANDKKQTIIIIDEAHAIESTKVFDELRLLLNFQRKDKFLLTLILTGQPELKDKVNQIKQLQQRIAISYYIDALDKNHTTNYIQHRMKTAGANAVIFTENAVEQIYQFSGGIPRRINQVCDLALLAGMGKNMTVIDEDIIKEISKDIDNGI
jgi:type II secretory pathway predicted ATPase ExeA